MEKSPDAFRTIGEVAEALVTPTHVLRFWESRFPQIRPVKRAGGRRYYRPADVALLTGIKHLLHDEGMTIRGVQKILREQGVRHVAGLSGQGDFADNPDGEIIESSMMDTDLVGADLVRAMMPKAGPQGGDAGAADLDLDLDLDAQTAQVLALQDELTQARPAAPAMGAQAGALGPLFDLGAPADAHAPQEAPAQLQDAPVDDLEIELRALEQQMAAVPTGRAALLADAAAALRALRRPVPAPLSARLALVNHELLALREQMEMRMQRQS